MLKKIRVAFFADILKPDFDGASRTIYQIIQRIPKTQFEFLFICGIPPSSSFIHSYVLVPTISIPFNEDYKMALPQLHLISLKAKLKEFNPDVIHVSTPSPLGKFGLYYGKNHKKPVITIYHTHFISYIDYYLKKWPILIKPVRSLLAKDQKRFYSNCDIVYVPTKSMVNELENFGFCSSNFKIWPRGIDCQKFSPTKTNKKKMESITGNKFKNILFVSRLVWEKNLITLVKVYELSRIKFPEINFIIVGDGVASIELKKLMPYAYFLGKLNHNELSEIYASCDVFLFPSVSETYGNVVSEAMASGLPCVIADGGGSAHFVRQGFNGYLCEPFDGESYLEAISKVLLNKDESKKFSERGLSYTSKLQWGHLADIYFEQLKTLVYKQFEPSESEMEVEMLAAQYF